jgi:cyclic pyranopterin phosphate synthase
MMKACLYDNGVLDLRKLLRSGFSDKTITLKIWQCLNHRYADGHETEMANVQKNEPSMATIGG